MEAKYINKINALKLQEDKLKSASKIYLYTKLLFFTMMLGSIYWAFISFSVVNVTAVILFLITYTILYVLDDKCRRRIDLTRRKQKVCENEIKYLKGDFTPFEAGEKHINLKHEFSYDLDIFGPSSLFNRINRTITKKGNDRLAKKLTTINRNKDEITQMQESILELGRLLDWRVKFLSNNQPESNLDLLSSFIFRSKHNRFIKKSKLPYVIISLTMVSLLLSLFNMLPIFWFFVMWSIQIFITITLSNISTKTNNNTDKLHKEYKGYLEILKDINQKEFQSKVLLDLKKILFDSKHSSLGAFNKLSRILNLFEQRNNAILYLILNGLFLYDVLLIKMFLKWGERYLSHVEEWVNCIAEIDVLVSFGTYSFNNPKNTLAQVLSDNSNEVIETVNFYHPFLSYHAAVPNSFTLNKSNITIVTGANMAGKSTFLRTIGITYIMASNGLPVCAESFKFAPVSLFSSMRTTDDLSNDISYFNAELIRLEQLIEHVKANDFTLIILDEILKGTNSKDKLKGSIMFLEEISKYKVSAVVATHDLELAKLEDKDNIKYSNYCFEIELSDEINYSYKLQSGVAKNLNASYLLSNIFKRLQ